MDHLALLRKHNLAATPHFRPVAPGPFPLSRPYAGTFALPPQRSLSTPGPGQRIDPRDYRGAEDVRHASESQRAETAYQRNPGQFRGVHNDRGALAYLNAVRGRQGKRSLGVGRNPQ